VLREHLVALAARTQLLAELNQQAFIDIDSLLRPVYGHAKPHQQPGGSALFETVFSDPRRGSACWWCAGSGSDAAVQTTAPGAAVTVRTDGV
jgi:hypothetical protein